jgi:hypothetical protein
MSNFENFTPVKFWVKGVTDNIKGEIDELSYESDKIEFLSDVINYCEKLKNHITTPKEYYIWDDWNKKICGVFSGRDDADDKCDWLIYNGDHSKYVVKVRYKTNQNKDE